LLRVARAAGASITGCASSFAAWVCRAELRAAPPLEALPRRSPPFRRRPAKAWQRRADTRALPACCDAALQRRRPAAGRLHWGLCGACAFSGANACNSTVLLWRNRYKIKHLCRATVCVLLHSAILRTNARTRSLSYHAVLLRVYGTTLVGITLYLLCLLFYSEFCGGEEVQGLRSCTCRRALKRETPSALTAYGRTCMASQRGALTHPAALTLATAVPCHPTCGMHATALRHLSLAFTTWLLW